MQPAVWAQQQQQQQQPASHACTAHLDRLQRSHGIRIAQCKPQAEAAQLEGLGKGEELDHAVLGAGQRQRGGRGLAGVILPHIGVVMNEQQVVRLQADGKRGGVGE